MARAKKEEPLPKGITQRPNGLYMGRFVMYGEKYTFYDRDLKALKKKIADAKYEIEHGTYIPESKTTVNGWFDSWLSEYKQTPFTLR